MTTEPLLSVYEAIKKEASEFIVANLMSHEIFVQILKPHSHQKFLTLMEKFPDVIASEQPKFFGYRFYKLYFRSPEAAFCAAIDCWFAPAQSFHLTKCIRGYEFDAWRISDRCIRCYGIIDPTGERSFPVPGTRVLNGITYIVIKSNYDAVDITRV
jgi:hypothetical protein